MKILVATPLFPPEKVYPAYFVKSLVENLKSKTDNNVSLMVYGEHPEVIIDVDIKTIKKDNIILLKFFKIIFSSFKFVKNHNIVILSQAGFFSFSVFIIAKILNKKVFLKIKEDETKERKRQFSLKENSLKLKLINLMQKNILRYSDFVFFDNKNLKKTFESRYKIIFNNYKILKHPEKYSHNPYSDWQASKQNEIEQWEKYISSFIEMVNSRKNIYE